MRAEAPKFPGESRLPAVAPDRPVELEFAFDRVYERHVHFIWRVLRGMGVRDASIEDAVQDVFVVVHRRLGDFDGRHSLKTWLFEIVYRVACEYRRKSKRLLKHEPFEDLFFDKGPGPVETAERNEAIELLGDLLDTLDDDKRAVLVLAELEQMTAPEIAELTGTRLNTVYTRLRRARIQFERALQAHRGET